jgi:hypothetical protein
LLTQHHHHHHYQGDMNHSSDSNDSIIDPTTNIRISSENGEINSLAPKHSESAIKTATTSTGYFSLLMPYWL